ncbi:unnamed protein product, partial [Pylaiella littoralis]
MWTAPRRSPRRTVPAEAWRPLKATHIELSRECVGSGSRWQGNRRCFEETSKPGAVAKSPSSKAATISSGRKQRCPVRDMVIPEPAVTPSRSSSRSSGRANKPARFSDAADD